MKHMEDWTEDMIHFMRDASDSSFYFENLSNVLVEFFDKNWTVCDAGCGIGQLALSLTGRVKKVFAVDKAKPAIEELKRKMKEQGEKHLVCINADMRTLPQEMKFNAIVFNYFGKMEDIFSISAKHCTDLVLIIKKGYQNHRFSIGKYIIENNCFTSAQQFLDERNINYSMQSFSSEFGQPFRNIEDALLFFDLYSRDEDRRLICEQNIRARLQDCSVPGYKFYLPLEKKSIIYKIRMNENSLKFE